MIVAHDKSDEIHVSMKYSNSTNLLATTWWTSRCDEANQWQRI